MLGIFAWSHSKSDSPEFFFCTKQRPIHSDNRDQMFSRASLNSNSWLTRLNKGRFSTVDDTFGYKPSNARQSKQPAWIDRISRAGLSISL